MIQVPADCRTEMVAHAREGAPREVCGLLGGSFGADRSRVASVHRAENVAALPRTEYEVDPEAAYRILERLESEGGELVGFYHSHPSVPARPSATDAARAYWPDRSYVIVSLDDGEEGGGEGAGRGDEEGIEVGSWRWRGEEFEREAVRITD